MNRVSLIVVATLLTNVATAYEVTPDLASAQRQCVAQAPAVAAVAACVTERLGAVEEPSVELYVLTAQQLADDVRARRTTEAAARVALQRALIEASASQRAAANDAAEAEQRALAASRAEYDARREERIRALQGQHESAMAAQDREAHSRAVARCRGQISRSGAKWYEVQALESECERDPSHFDRRAPVVTTCEPWLDGMRCKQEQSP